MKKTKILCTIGPACSSVETLRLMFESGMNAARINTSHGSFEEYKELIANIRNVANIPIVMDTQGPKIRLRMQAEVTVKKGDEMIVGFDNSYNNHLDSDVYDYLNVGDRALLDDGNFISEITDKKDKTITLKFMNGGHVVSGRAVNFPRKNLPMAALTEKDIESLRFATNMEIDFIALSFARGKDDIETARAYLKDSKVKIIAKIENQQGVDNFEEILMASDGVMVARGDMGVELEVEEIPIIQKRLIARCNEKGKLVITATQMLQSMITNPRPTRAEISDVANAILDGSDIVMLSGETATGKYPVETVKMMSRLAIYSEKYINRPPAAITKSGVEMALCDSIKTICERAGVDKIVTVTRQGHTARLISRLRLQPDIIALTSKDFTFRELHLYYGVTPVNFPHLRGIISTSEAGMFLFRKGYLKDEDLVLFASGEYHPREHFTNTIQIIRMQDLHDYCEKHDLA